MDRKRGSMRDDVARVAYGLSSRRNGLSRGVSNIRSYTEFKSHETEV